MAKINHPKGESTWNYTPSLPNGISVTYPTSNSIAFTASYNLYTDSIPSSFYVSVTNNSTTSKQLAITIGSADYTRIPADKTYFKFTKTVRDNDTIAGFSDDVNDGLVQIPAKYNTLDFTLTNVKYVAAAAAFKPSVFAYLQLKRLSLATLYFECNAAGSTGYQMFKDCNFP